MTARLQDLCHHGYALHEVSVDTPHGIVETGKVSLLLKPETSGQCVTVRIGK